MRTPSAVLRLLAATIAALPIAIGISHTHAQTDVPASHPAAIVAGSCAAPGEAVVPLPAPTASFGGAQADIAVAVATVPQPLSALVATPHAILVHAAEPGDRLVCGDIGGVVVNGVLLVGLAPADGGRANGIAVLTDAGVGVTAVEIVVVADAAVTSDGLAFDGAATSHPTALFSGSCAKPGTAVSDLGAATDPAWTVPATPVAVGQANPMAIWTTTDVVGFPLADLVATPHVITVHHSADEMETLVLCGKVAGEPLHGVLVVELHEVGASGHDGVAWLEDLGDGTTRIRVFPILGVMVAPAA